MEISPAQENECEVAWDSSVSQVCVQGEHSTRAEEPVVDPSSVSQQGLSNEEEEAQGKDEVDFVFFWDKNKSLLQHSKEEEEAQGKDEVDFVFFWDKSKSLLQHSRDRTLSPELLGKVLEHRRTQQGSKDVESIDSVDKEGFGAIHYIVMKNHKKKHQLLEMLIIRGAADVDLTTTYHNGLTALHIAVERNDLECVEVLISLDADVNKEDLLGNTPLDIANFRSKLNMTPHNEVKMTVLDHETSQATNLETTIEVSQMPGDLTEKRNYRPIDDISRKIKNLLESVGACAGRSSSTQKERSSVRHSTSLSPEEGVVNTTTTITTVPTQFRKINTKWYGETHDCIWESLKSETQALSPERAFKLVSDMRKQEVYRRKCGSRILCLDGGGIRGLIQMTVLRELERRTKKRIVELFDWIVGTSTGGIIALALTYGPPDVGPRTVRLLRDLYWGMKEDIFGECQDGLLGFLARGNTKKLEEMLQTWLGKETKLADQIFPKVVIPAVSKKKSNLELHFFNNCFEDDYSEELVWKVARYTSAAPFYFTEFEDYIDGGMLANNPTQAALTVIQDHFHNRGEKIPISLVVSVGSGIQPGNPLGKIDLKANLLNPKTYLNFLQVVESSLLNKQTTSDSETCCREQNVDYFRFNPRLNQKVDSGEVESQVLHEMILATRQYLKDRKEDIDKLVELLLESELTST